MSEQLEKLNRAEPFGKVHLKTEKFRRKFHLPPSYLLDVLNSNFQDADYSCPVPLLQSSEFLVEKYVNGARYTQGHTVYEPLLSVREETVPYDDGGLVVSINATDDPHNRILFDDLDVDKDGQYAYELLGRTWWPGHAITQRIAEHDRLLTIGTQLITLVQSANPERDFSGYSAQKVIG